jgi:hypothetical protein
MNSKARSKIWNSGIGFNHFEKEGGGPPGGAAALSKEGRGVWTE